MNEFLYGADLSAKIRHVVAGNDFSAAVAFWGNDAVKELFGDEVLNRDDVSIVCDLSMGGTNPETLRKLRAPNNKKLKHLPGLHAKVYLSVHGVVITSANASNNGIGFMGAGAGLHEAGVFFEADTNSWFQTVMWFQQEIWPQAVQIDELALNCAQIAWRNRHFGHNPTSRFEKENSQEVRSFLEYDPERHGLVYTLGHGDTPEEVDYSLRAETELDASYNENSAHMAPQDIDLRGSWVCSFWIANNGYVDRRLKPRFFYANTLIEHAVEGDPGYENLIGEHPNGIREAEPFNFDDRLLKDAFIKVINNQNGVYAALRGEPYEELWLARNNIERMTQFWRDVQSEYRQLAQQR